MGALLFPLGGVSLAEWSVMVDRYNPVVRLQIVVTARYSMLGRALPLEAEVLRKWGIKCTGFNSPWSKTSGDRGCKGGGGFSPWMTLNSSYACYREAILMHTLVLG